tara:strand:- start:13496 stop:15112 length:1617 start_codon:yes stop_codon:yes gene_type:complete
VNVTDGSSVDSEQFNIYIVDINDAPVIANQSSYINNNLSTSSTSLTREIREDGNIIFSVNYTDADGDETATAKWYLRRGLEDYIFMNTGNSYTYTPGSDSQGAYSIKVVVTDGIASVQKIWDLTVLNFVDTDGDGITDVEDICPFNTDNGACLGDLDGDGINDTDDNLVGNETLIDTTIEDLNIRIDSSENLSQSFASTQKVEFTTSEIDVTTNQSVEVPIVSFSFDFSNTLNLANLSIKEETTIINGETIASIVISGLDLTSQGQRKTVYMDRLDTTKNSICIRDEEVASISELSTGCDSSGEVKVECDGTSQSGYTCTLNSSINKYQVAGLVHSGVRQIQYTKPAASSSPPSSGGGGGSGGWGGGGCAHKWECEEWGECIEGIQTRECTYTGSCSAKNENPGTRALCEMPVEEQEEEQKEKEEKVEEISFEEVIKEEEPIKTEGVFSKITGAVIGAISRKGSIIGLIFILVVVIGGGGTFMVTQFKNGAFGADDFAKASYLHRKAERIYRSGKHRKAEEMYRKAQIIREKAERGMH